MAASTGTEFSSMLHQLVKSVHTKNNKKGKKKAGSPSDLLTMPYDGHKVVQQSVDAFRQLVEKYKSQQVNGEESASCKVLYFIVIKMNNENFSCMSIYD